jgi:hypothetical protein
MVDYADAKVRQILENIKPGGTKIISFVKPNESKK